MKGNFCCKHCSKDDIDEKLIDIWTLIEKNIKKIYPYYEVEITSGARCYSCNIMVGGSTYSSHIVGNNKKCLAFDVAVNNGVLFFYVLKEIFRTEITGIGIGRNFIHTDIDIKTETKIRPCLWFY